MLNVFYVKRNLDAPLPHRPRRRGFRAFGLLVGVAPVLIASCHLVVSVPITEPFPVEESAPSPLTTAELVRFTYENLGEVAPGFAYRSAAPTRSLLEFLGEQKNLGHIVSFRRHPSDVEAKVAEEIGATVHILPMSAGRPPRPDQILELIRLTQEARADGNTMLFHCRGGADRTGVMMGIWRILFQDVSDRDALKREAFLYRHFTAAHPKVYDVLETFQPELFLPFVDDPSLLEDAEKIAEVEKRYFAGFPLRSGTTDVTSGPLRAGTAKADLFENWEGPMPMATYGPNPGEAQGIAEAVYARALVIENGRTRLAVVSCDLLLIDPVVRARVLAEIHGSNIGVDDLLLSATHTHTSLGSYARNAFGEFYILNEFDPEIQDRLVEKIVTAIREAAGAVRPARLGAGRTFVEGLSFNRRLGDTVDPELGVIKLIDQENNPLAVLVNYAAHPILERETHISSDYPGQVCRWLDEHHGFGIFLQGALGDVNAQAPGRRDEWREDGLAEEVSGRLVAALEATLPTIEVVEDVQLGSMTHDMRLPTCRASPVPDLFVPLDRCLTSLVDWPTTIPVQTVRIGPVALIACATEAGVRLGLRIKRRSPAPFPFVVTHANGYGGYAVTQVGHAKRKLDPTSLILNSSRHGAELVETACDLLEVQWGTRLDPEESLLSPASAARVEEESVGLSPAERAALRDEVKRREAKELFLDEDPTSPQTRKVSGAVSDSLAERVRFEADGLYVDRARGGDHTDGQRRELTGRVRLRAPQDFRLDLEIGYVRSDWDGPGGRGSDEGATDLRFGLERPFTLTKEERTGNALRVIPRVAMSAPTADADSDAPFAFAAGAGVWRPSFGGALEFTWETYHTFTLESIYVTSLDRHDGRRPGDRWESSIGYRERHGAASLFVDFTAGVQLKDQRRSGRTEVDVDESSFALALRPGLSWRFGERVEAFFQGTLPVGHSGDAGEGRGGRVGIVFGF